MVIKPIEKKNRWYCRNLSPFLNSPFKRIFGITGYSKGLCPFFVRALYKSRAFKREVFSEISSTSPVNNRKVHSPPGSRCMQMLWIHLTPKRCLQIYNLLFLTSMFADPGSTFKTIPPREKLHKFKLPRKFIHRLSGK